MQPVLRDLRQVPLQIDVFKTIKNDSVNLLDAFVDLVFEFVDQPLLPSQSNFAPVDELKEALQIINIEGKIPDNFPEDGDGSWNVVYNKRHRNKPSFLPANEGDSTAILFAYLLNLLRFGKVNKYISNTNIFEHSGKFYSIAENHMPQEIDILTLDTLGNWDVNGAWKRPFTSHPKRALGTEELVIVGVDATKPFLELEVISAEGKKLVHKVDLKLDRCSICHDIGLTQRYNVIMDFPLTIGIKRLISGGPLIKYSKEEYARIGIIPRYGDSDSIRWFEVQPNYTFHILNCFEDDNEVNYIISCSVGGRALDSIIPGPDKGLNKFEWLSKRFKPINSIEGYFNSSPEDGLLGERNLTGTEFSMDFPMINENFTGIKNKYGYTQVVDSISSSTSGLVKFGGLAKLNLEELDTRFSLRKRHQEELIKVEYHMFEEKTFCTGAAFVSKGVGFEEDDGWIITFVHNEDTDISEVHIIDTKNFSSEPVAKIRSPCRVPYGFHGAFMSMSL
ncbi:hypothetical protein RGQ29_008259 [Quercus rubra]|uniref:Uncharacterized protein n=1 Tax=Quercus rubra TaxID=3512 RepID=A0AAN7DZR3_QUERU|nr:hypothetical protein RGQ29_008259 [Quercus rubra]